MLSSLRKAVGKAVFNSVVVPPEVENAQLVHHGGDYGHGYLYEEIFCREDQDIRTAFEIISQDDAAVLDLGGGGGRFSWRLAESGRKACLVDKSFMMLEIARRRKKSMENGLSHNFQILPQDLCKLQLKSQYKWAFSINHAFEHLESEGNVLRALKRLHKHLEKDAEFYLDVHYLPFWQSQKNWAKSEWEYSQDFRHQGQRFRVWSRTRKTDESDCIEWNHAVTSNFLIYRFLKTKLLMLSLSRWHNLIEQGGFKVLDIWGDWKRAKISKDLPKMIFKTTPR